MFCHRLMTVLICGDIIWDSSFFLPLAMMTSWLSTLRSMQFVKRITPSIPTNNELARSCKVCPLPSIISTPRTYHRWKSCDPSHSANSSGSQARDTWKYILLSLKNKMKCLFSLHFSKKQKNWGLLSLRQDWQMTEGQLLTVTGLYGRCRPLQ